MLKQVLDTGISKKAMAILNSFVFTLDTGISNKAMAILNSFVNNIIERIAAEASSKFVARNVIYTINHISVEAGSPGYWYLKQALYVLPLRLPVSSLFS